MNKYILDKIKSLNIDQKILFDQLKKNNLLQVCIPTGAGKGYLMMVDILTRIKKESIFVISSHRLMLNTQHLNDLFEMFSPFIGDIGFIFVGSSKYDTSKFQENVEFNKALLKKNLSYNDIVSSTTNSKELDKVIKFHTSNNRKVVILTTYHSLCTLKNVSIDTIYFDEAHTLASAEEGAIFRQNFESISSKNKYFLTATPKDQIKQDDEDVDSFLMNNASIFGERVGLTFKECVEKGYMVKPVVHIAMPDGFDPSLEFKSVGNMVKFVSDTFYAHKDWLEKVSSDFNKIKPKLLVKCSSVDDMWDIHSDMVGKLEGVKICAGASRNDKSNFNHFIDSVGIAGRSEYLENIQMFSEDQMAIVLHYDTMSEGINVSGFTGVEFLGGKLPTIIKTLQNTGRATRLHPVDRSLFRNGDIKVGDGKWIKPYCAVIIPYWDVASEFTTAELSKQIKGLRDNFAYDPIYYVSIGSDIGDGESEDDMDLLNKKDLKDKKSELIEKINHDIEQMDKEELNMIESLRISSLSKLELLKEKLGI